MLCGSKIILQVGAIESLSPLAKVRVLLSSRTELRFSIQMLSTGPSRTNQTYSPGFSFRVLRQRAEKMPSVQSLVATSKRPNIWAAVIAFGFILISLREA